MARFWHIAAVQIEYLTSPDQLDRLEPLWLMLNRHHQQVAPELAPFVSDEDSWRVRRRIYAHVLAEGGLVAIATSAGRDLGYIVAGGGAMHWTATFDAPHTVTELVTLLVTPEARGQGVGSQLMERFEERYGDTPALVGVLPQNTRAIEFYRRLGFVPCWLTMSRLQRPRDPGPITAAWEPITPAEIEQVRDLWLQLHHHHQAVAPELGPYLDDAASWAAMREILVTGAENGLAFRIGPADAPLAMMTGSIGRDTEIWDDSWLATPPIAEPDVLVVADGARGEGLGSALMDIYDATVAERGATDQVLGVIVPNHDAIRLYERRGFRPAYMEMTRFRRD